MEISKNTHKFFVKGKFSEDWFLDKFCNWENDTFHILEYYKNKTNGIYIDIGAWIGPTVLYASNIYKKVIAVEPDRVAIQRLKENLSVNSFDNIVLIEKGLSNTNGKTNFGGNGELGNSESTLLAAYEGFYKYDGRHTSVWKNKHLNNIIEIETITFETLLEENKIKPEDISLIKMDIEGGEVIVVPSIKDFLKKYKPKFYISLHPCFLRKCDISFILDILFEVYDKCYYFTSLGAKKEINKESIATLEKNSLVFE